jgi:acylglycerol lipase
LFFLDRRGSGMNEPWRGHAAHHERLLNDLSQFLADLRWQHRNESPARPTVLLSVSWGGKLAAVTAAQRPELVDALALLYPGICSRVRAKWHQNLRLSLARRLGIRKKQIPIPLRDPALFTGEPEWCDYIRDDPLALHRVTVSFLLANRELDRLAKRAPAGILCPALLMLAGKDRITDNVRSSRYFRAFGSTQRKLIEYGAAQHTLEFEPRRDWFVADLLQWLSEVGEMFPATGSAP